MMLWYIQYHAISREAEEDGRVAGGTRPDADGALPDDQAEWDDYVPDGVQVSEAEKQRLRGEHEKYVAELVEEVGEPTPEEMAQAEAWWRPIKEHLRKSART